jgi:excisionase family DNA binding protein
MALKDEYYTISQAAKMIGVARQTISRWIDEGKIPAEKIGREVLIAKNEVITYIKNHSLTQLSALSMDDLVKRIRERYGYSNEVSFKKGDGTRETIYFLLGIGDAEPLISDDWQSLRVGLIYPVEKIERVIDKV